MTTVPANRYRAAGFECFDAVDGMLWALAYYPALLAARMKGKAVYPVTVGRGFGAYPVSYVVGPRSGLPYGDNFTYRGRNYVVGRAVIPTVAEVRRAARAVRDATR